jgi:hypothetical protein
MKLIAVLVVAVALATVVAGYLRILRPRHVRWGATDDEVRRPMSGDILVQDPVMTATRAVSVRARPEEIWLWLVQMGYKRAGFYSYDWIDNARVPSADHILPGFQGIKAGDVVPTGPRGEGFTVVSLEPNRSLLMEVNHPRFHVMFSTLLNPVNEEETRLVMRVRAAVRFNPLTAVYYAIFEPGDFVMMRKMMLGIKQRAEAMADERRAHTRVFEDVLLEAMKYG